MCRLVAYLGQKVLLEEVVVKPSNSIIMQSLHARETTVPTNGDGFGLGWYAPHINPRPALFTSVFPAWSNRNLLHLTAKIESPCFFAHVRAAGVGGVSDYNCHPFSHGKWMLMHNGDIANFISIKRHLRHLLDDDIYNWIRGETDSEHLFALFLQLAKGKDLEELEVVSEVFAATLKKVKHLEKRFGKQKPSFFNVCLTDGQRLLASRYCSDQKCIPESLHYFTGYKLSGPYHKEQINSERQCILVASEKLNEIDAEWQDVPANHLLLVDYDHRIQLKPLEI